MSFELANGAIRVRDTNDDVIFDTDTPMPHIVATITNTVNHTFPENGDGAGAVQYFRDAGGNCSFTVCRYDFDLADVVCVDEPRDGYYTRYRSQVTAMEHSQTYTLGTVASGTNPDFLMVLLNASRSVAGSHSDVGTFVSAIPTGQTIAGNGSTVLESAFHPAGYPWLTRILSVFIDGNAIKAEFKHSNRAYDEQTLRQIVQCGSYAAPVVFTNATRSVWSVAFTVYVGKFTAS